MTRLRSGSATDVGRVRERNEDWVLDADSLFAVADGMGGHAGGEVASRTAVEALQSAFEEDRSGPGLVRAVHTANLAVWERSMAERDLRGMGTTLTAAALVRSPAADRLSLVNVGDSRAYLLRRGELSQVTDDHSHVQEMVRSGELTAEEAELHPQRHILTRALGVEPEVEVDAWEIEPATGDRVLICSDGLVNEVGDAEIASVLERKADPQAAAREMVSLARAHGGNDNITVVVVDVLEGEGAPSGAARSAVMTGEAGALLAPDDPPAPDNRPGPGSLATTAIPIVAAQALAGNLDRQERRTAPRQADRPTAPGAVRLRPRRITVRVVAFVAALLAVLAGAAAVVGWFASRSYYVGLSGNEIVIYQGRPGGILWFQPRVRERTAVTTADVLPSRVQDLRSGTEEPSLGAARSYVSNLVSEARSTSGAPGTPAPGEPTPAVAPSGPAALG